MLFSGDVYSSLSVFEFRIVLDGFILLLISMRPWYMNAKLYDHADNDRKMIIFSSIGPAVLSDCLHICLQ